MSTAHLRFRWWLDADGFLWVRHDCKGIEQIWHPDSRWSLTEAGDIEPSFRCDRCGDHTILTAADRVENPWPHDEVTTDD